jgi:hypothetical protein
VYKRSRIGEPLKTFQYLAAISAAEAHIRDFLGIGWLKHKGFLFSLI